MFAELPNAQYNRILVVNALNGAFPLVLREAFPDARITCAEVFPFFKDHLKSLGFEVVDWAWNKDWCKVKFDLVIGNPPYQNKNETGGARSLWRRFVSKSFELARDGGTVCLVTPGCPYNSSDLGSFFKEYQTLWVKTELNQHFPGIGSAFVAWCVHKVPTYQLTNYLDLGVEVDLRNRVWDQVYDTVTESILTKILAAKRKFGVYDCKQDRVYSSNDLHTKPEKYGENPDPSRPYRVRHASKLEYAWGDTPSDCHFKRKVMMTFSGYPNFRYYDETNPVSSCYQMSGYILVDTLEEGNQLINNLNLKINKFERAITGKGGFSGITTYQHAKLPINKQITDQEAYSVINLSTDEIGLVEKIVGST